jgi:peptidoglycan/xylan/chitin deacetylase (PgdA/CDA1 family)
MSRFAILNMLFIAGAVLTGYLVFSGFTSWYSLLFLALAYLLILIAGVSRVDFELFMDIENSGDNRYNKIALSFDDGPNPEITPEVLDKLARYGVKAAFFCIGGKVEEHQALAGRIHREGHILGNHSFYHKNDFPFQKVEAIKEELQNCNRAIARACGFEPLFFRPPFGVTNPRIAKAVKELEMTTIGWSLRTFDTAKSPEKVIKKLRKKLTGGDLILLHDNHPGVLEILDFLIPYAEQQGLEFVRPDGLLAKEGERALVQKEK